MNGCEVICAQLSKEVKKSVCNKVLLMGGSCSKTFSKSITHLVCGGTKSEEYRLAGQQGVKAMLPSWIDYLYEASRSSHLNPDDPEIVEKHKCPIFYQLTICTTGIGSKNKQLERVVAENGGTYAAKLVLAKTDILVCGDSTSSEKLKAARKSRRVVCVTLSWIHDSIRAGYSLPYEGYIVKVATSTPTKDRENIDPNFSTLSTISTIQNTLKTSVINDTVGDVYSIRTPKITHEKKTEKLIESMDLKNVSSSSCLDGCSILVAGFRASEQEKLNKIIDVSGATRYDAFASRVTHVIVGDLNCPEISIVKSKDCWVVNVQWLLDSVELGKPAKEQNYIINLNSGTLSSSNSTYWEQETTNKESEEDTLAKLLRGQNFTEADGDFKHNSTSTQTTEFPPLFHNLTFHLDGFDQETTEKFKESITAFYGEIVGKDTCHYAVYPVIWNAQKHAENQTVVNELWLSKCLEDGVVQDPSNYFFAIVKQPETAPLRSCVLSISNYTPHERLFLKSIIKSLGGICQDQFLCKQLPDRQLLASTHLICPEARGKKFEAATRWNIPAVSKDWLLDCLQTESLQPVDEYLISAFQANTPENHKRTLCPITPINQIIRAVMHDNILHTPTTPDTPYPWTVKTPDTPLGQFVRPDPSPELRKEMQRYVNSYPEFVPPVRRRSTPLSELRQRLWQKCFGQEASTHDNTVTEQARDMESTEVAISELQLSQSDCEIPHTQEKIFMLSTIPVEERQQLTEDLEELGANISTSITYNPSVTHLICLKPGRNEKALASIASGKWILHVSYITKSKQAGRFLNEEEFEFGNPKAKNKPFFDPKDHYVHYWRKKISERGYGAFYDMRAIVVAEKQNSLINVIEAGGGVVVDIEPPYNDTFEVTHCLMEIKMIKNYVQYVPLAQQGIKCYNIFYLSQFLSNANDESGNEDFKDFIVPYFANYYH